MSILFSQQVAYTRVKNGVDIYALQTATKDVVVCRMAFTGGRFATYTKQSVALLLGDLLPCGTQKKTKKEVLEAFNALGAQISMQVGEGYLHVSLATRKSVFVSAFELLFEIFTSPHFQEGDVETSKVRVKSLLHHAKEDTKTQAKQALSALLYKKGHPNWSPTIDSVVRELGMVDTNDINTFFNATLGTVGACICVAGDIQEQPVLKELTAIVTRLVRVRTLETTVLSPLKLVEQSEAERILPIKDKVNIDTCFVMPVSLTRDHSAFFALSMGVNILGSSSTSKLFQTLRVKRNLTYGAYASIDGADTIYPVCIKGSAIFPNTVFKEGKEVLKETLDTFLTRGVSGKELQEQKEESVGRFAIRLSSTEGVCATLFQTVLLGRSLEYIDGYSERVQALSHTEVTKAIREYVRGDMLKIAAAGSVDKTGSPA
jgi:zinc protease